jgi:hypothetical protein
MPEGDEREKTKMVDAPWHCTAFLGLASAFVALTLSGATHGDGVGTRVGLYSLFSGCAAASLPTVAALLILNMIK